MNFPELVGSFLGKCVKFEWITCTKRCPESFEHLHPEDQREIIKAMPAPLDMK